MYLYVRTHVRCMMPELARLLARSESSRDVLDCRFSKFLSAGKPLAVRILSKTGGMCAKPGVSRANRESWQVWCVCGGGGRRLMQDWRRTSRKSSECWF